MPGDGLGSQQFMFYSLLTVAGSPSISGCKKLIMVHVHGSLLLLLLYSVGYSNTKITSERPLFFWGKYAGRVPLEYIKYISNHFFPPARAAREDAVPRVWTDAGRGGDDTRSPSRKQRLSDQRRHTSVARCRAR